MKRKNSTCSRMSSSRYSFHHLLSKLIFPHNNLFHVLVVVLSFPTTTSLHIISSTTTQSLPLWGGRSIRLYHRCSSSDDSGKCYYNYNSINPSIPSTSFIQTHLSSNLNNNDMEGDNNIGLQQPSLLALAFPPIPPSLPTLDGDADRALKYGIELEDIGKCRAASAAFHEAATLYQCFLDSYSEENEAEEDQEVGWMMREEDSLLPSHAFSHVTGLRAPSFSSSSLLLSEEEENGNGNNGDNTNTLDNTNHLTTTTTITTGVSNSNDSSSSINNDDNDTPASALAFACVRLADIYHDALGDSRAANRLYRDVAKIMDAMTRKRVKCMEMESKIMMLNNRKLKTNREGEGDDNNDDEGNEMLVGDGENKIILPPLPSPPSRGVHDGIGITLEGSGGRLEDAVEAYRRALSPFGRPIIDSNNELKQHDSSFTKDENNNNDQDNESIGYDDDQLGYVDNELDYLGTDHYYNRYDHHRDHHRSNNQWWLDYDEREEHHRPAAISFRLAVALERLNICPEESERRMERLRRSGAADACLVDSWGYVRWHTRKYVTSSSGTGRGKNNGNDNGKELLLHRGTRNMLQLGIDAAMPLILSNNNSESYNDKNNENNDNEPGLVCEFGAGPHGRTLRMIQEMLPLHIPLHGFDFFDDDSDINDLERRMGGRGDSNNIYCNDDNDYDYEYDNDIDDGRQRRRRNNNSNRSSRRRSTPRSEGVRRMSSPVVAVNNDSPVPTTLIRPNSIPQMLGGGECHFHRGPFRRSVPRFLGGGSSSSSGSNSNRSGSSNGENNSEEDDGGTDHIPPRLAFANIDCDSYGSTLDVLEAVHGRVVPGTVLVFGDYLCHPTWRQDEFRAWRECCKRFGWQYEYLAFSLGTRQAVVRVTAA